VVVVVDSVDGRRVTVVEVPSTVVMVVATLAAGVVTAGGKDGAPWSLQCVTNFKSSRPPLRFRHMCSLHAGQRMGIESAPLTSPNSGCHYARFSLVSLDSALLS